MLKWQACLFCNYRTSNDRENLEWALIFCMSNKLSGDANISVHMSHFGEAKWLRELRELLVYSIYITEHLYVQRLPTFVNTECLEWSTTSTTGRGENMGSLRSIFRSWRKRIPTNAKQKSLSDMVLVLYGMCEQVGIFVWVGWCFRKGLNLKTGEKKPLTV